MLLGVAAVVVLLLANGGYQAARAVRDGTEGKSALLRAEGELNSRRPDQARLELAQARTAFRRVRSDLEAMGPLLLLARVTPFVRVQTRGVEAFADAGAALSQAGIGLTDSASAVLEPADEHVPVSGAVGALGGVHASLVRAVKALEVATARVASLNGYRLLGPIGSARDDLAARLPRINSRAASAEQGLGGLLAFAGGSGPRRYLLFSQNPAEIRPTGGFIGTFGVLVAEPGQLRLERFEAINDWLNSHPQAVIPADQAPAPLLYSVPPARQTIANVNVTPDWPQASRLAADLWQKGGEQPVDGVLSVTPGFLSRVLTVLGAVDVPSYGETITAANVVERFDFYTKQVETLQTTNATRKNFVVELAQTVMQRLLAAPASQWDPLARVIGDAFTARQALAWSTDDEVRRALATRGWDGTLPVGPGDFFFGGEFHFETKNGLGLHRTYDHQVDLHPDGSARVTTVVTINNTRPRSPLNDVSVIYLTTYGPEGATLDPSSDPLVRMDAPLGRHPAASWFRSAGPLSSATLKVVWNVPNLAQRGADGSWDVLLRWMPLPDHAGDVLNLQVNLPAGWSWRGGTPPAAIPLDREVKASWKAGP